MFWNTRNKEIIFVHFDKCSGCGNCTKACRHHVLTMIEINDEKRAVANCTDRCSRCGKCMISCHKRAIELVMQMN